MVDLHRRLTALVLLTLLVFAFTQRARAETIPASGGTTYAATANGTRWNYYTPGVTGETASTGTSAQSNCNTAGVILNKGQQLNAVQTGVNGQGRPYGECQYTGAPYTPGQYAFGWATYPVTNYECPNGGTLSGTTCTIPLSCPAGQGYSLQGSNCVRCDPLPGEQRNADGSCGCPSSGTIIGDTGTTLTFVPPSTVTGTRVCFGYCQFDADGCIKGYLGGQLKGTECYGPLKSAGQGCIPSTFGGGAVDPSQPTPIEPTKPGYCWGTVNDQPVQLPCDKTTQSSGNTVPSSTLTTNPDGTSSKDTTTSSSTTNCDGEKCKTTETTTTTTTTYDANGNPTGTTTRTETQVRNPQDSEMGKFCQDNPNSPMCKSGAFGGSCASGFTCEGDAVQCALAREVHTRNCTLFNNRAGGATTGDASTWYDANSKGEGLTKAGNASLFQDGTLPAIDTTSRGIAAAQLQDVSFQVWGGQSLTLPFASLATYLGYMGNVLVAVALIIAARIFHQGATA